jgi:hypothetical protein
MVSKISIPFDELNNEKKTILGGCIKIVYCLIIQYFWVMQDQN